MTSIKKILIATGNNASLVKSLDFPGIAVEEIPAFPEGFSEYERCASLNDSLLVCEINTRNANDIMSFFRKYAPASFGHFCIYPEFDGLYRSSLIDIGMCDIITSADPRLIFRCLRTVCFGERHPFRGTVHLMSDTLPFARLLNTAVRRFHYEVKNAHSTDELIRLSEKGTPDLFLVDMDTSGFDSIEFAKKASASSSLKKAPLVFYKDMRNGLFVHDINPNLQRLAKVILSREELLNLLLTLFFLAEIASPAQSFAAFLRKTDLSDKKSLREIFYAGGPDLCYMGNFFSHECFSTMANAGRNIIDLIERIEPLRWMISPLEKRPTCAGGV